mmetsp:Transcript_39595/g.119673  ORF Transcript_39595/g.119673 Transcript_39595/m.119673 type:complete len:224 (-) Transcript_39595:296-967(-)
MFCVSRCAARSIFVKVSFGTMAGGPSSKIFWKRRCVEQSRPLSATALPCMSPTIWTSMWRAPWQSCMTKMGDPGGASLCTWGKLAWISSFVPHMRMPLPPPPSDALTITGKPMRSAHAMASSAFVTKPFLKVSSGMVPSGVKSAVKPSPDQGMEGTPAVCARMLAAILSPSTDMTGEVGPMKVIPSSFNCFGKSGFSEACPQPGHTASAFCALATSQMRSTLA